MLNERLFELDKKKQDRIINSALSVFSRNGFSRASTDEITERAGISKGLLFHYFGSKAGAYAFLYEYSVRYVSLVIKNEFRDKERDFFKMCRRLVKAEAIILQTYPGMLLFLHRAQSEQVPDMPEHEDGTASDISAVYRGLYDEVRIPEGRTEKEKEDILKMLDLCRVGVQQELLASGGMWSSTYRDRMDSFIDIIEKAPRK